MTLGMGMKISVLVFGRDPHRRMTSPTLNKLGLETLTDGVTYCYKWFLSYFITVYTFLQYFKQETIFYFGVYAYSLCVQVQ